MSGTKKIGLERADTGKTSAIMVSAYKDVGNETCFLHLFLYRKEECKEKMKKIRSDVP